MKELLASTMPPAQQVEVLGRSAVMMAKLEQEIASTKTGFKVGLFYAPPTPWVPPPRCFLKERQQPALKQFRAWVVAMYNTRANCYVNVTCQVLLGLMDFVNYLLSPAMLDHLSQLHVNSWEQVGSVWCPCPFYLSSILGFSSFPLC